MSCLLQPPDEAAAQIADLLGRERAVCTKRLLSYSSGLKQAGLGQATEPDLQASYARMGERKMIQIPFQLHDAFVPTGA
jgi:hypothetical protein